MWIGYGFHANPRAPVLQLKRPIADMPGIFRPAIAAVIQLTPPLNSRTLDRIPCRMHQQLQKVGNGTVQFHFQYKLIHNPNPQIICGTFATVKRFRSSQRIKHKSIGCRQVWMQHALPGKGKVFGRQNTAIRPSGLRAQIKAVNAAIFGNLPSMRDTGNRFQRLRMRPGETFEKCHVNVDFRYPRGYLGIQGLRIRAIAHQQNTGSRGFFHFTNPLAADKQHTCR